MLKTNSSCKKRFKVKISGGKRKIIMMHACHRHGMTKRNSNTNREKACTSFMKACDARKILKVMVHHK